MIGKLEKKRFFLFCWSFWKESVDFGDVITLIKSVRDTHTENVQDGANGQYVRQHQVRFRADLNLVLDYDGLSLMEPLWGHTSALWLYGSSRFRDPPPLISYPPRPTKRVAKKKKRERKKTNTKQRERNLFQIERKIRRETVFTCLFFMIMSQP